MFRVGRQVGDGDSADAGAGARVPVLIERAQVDVVVESFPCDATCALQVGPYRPPALALRRPGPGRRRATEPLGRRPDPYFYIWAPGSPAQLLPEATRDEIAGSFARRVILHQPLAYARTVATDVARGFAPTRATHGPTEALWRWQFQPRVPLFVDGLLCGDRRANHLEARQCASMLAGLQRFAARYGEHDLAVRPALARRLTNYRRFAYLPGPLLALALLTGAAGAVVAARRRATHLAAGCFLLTAVAVILIVGPIATVHFAWRYEILALTLVPVCGALGLTALTQKARRDGPS